MIWLQLHTWTGLYLCLLNYVQYVPTWWLNIPAQSLKFTVMSVSSNLTIYIWTQAYSSTCIVTSRMGFTEGPPVAWTILALFTVGPYAVGYSIYSGPGKCLLHATQHYQPLTNHFSYITRYYFNATAPSWRTFCYSDMKLRQSDWGSTTLSPWQPTYRLL